MNINRQYENLLYLWQLPSDMEQEHNTLNQSLVTLIPAQHQHTTFACDCVMFARCTQQKTPLKKMKKQPKKQKIKSEPMPTLKLLSFANRKIALWNCLMIYRQKESWNKHKIIINWSNNKISKRMNKKKTFQLLSGLNSPFDRRKW